MGKHDELIRRLTEATEGSRELDADFALAIGAVPPNAFRMHGHSDPALFGTGAYSSWAPRHYTTSLDAITREIEARFPAYILGRGKINPSEPLYGITIFADEMGDREVSVAEHNHRELCACIAFLRAMEPDHAE